MLMTFQRLRLRPALGIAAGLVTALATALVTGCADSRDPLFSALARPAANELGSSNVHGSFICTVRLAPAGKPGAPSVTCRPKNGALAGPTLMKAEDVVLGKQKVNVQLNISNPSFNSSTRLFSLSASITNLLAQPIGTTDGTTTTAAGTRVFFTSGPSASGGTGSVFVLNPSGFGSFQGNTVPYFQYTPLIASGDTSAAKTWVFLLG